MPKNRQHNRKTKYPDKVTKPKRLVLVRIFLFCSVGIKIQYFPTAPLLIYIILLLAAYLHISLAPHLLGQCHPFFRHGTFHKPPYQNILFR